MKIKKFKNLYWLSLFVCFVYKTADSDITSVRSLGMFHVSFFTFYQLKRGGLTSILTSTSTYVFAFMSEVICSTCIIC